MKTKRVLRYYCEFCKKSGCGKNAMIKHELHCTMNPNRICGVCKFLGTEQIPALVLNNALILPKVEEESHGFMESFMSYSFDVDDPLKALKELTDCPACTLATIRQSGYAFTYNYDYKEAMKKVFDDYNEEQYELCMKEEMASIEGRY